MVSNNVRSIFLIVCVRVYMPEKLPVVRTVRLLFQAMRWRQKFKAGSSAGSDPGFLVGEAPSLQRAPTYDFPNVQKKKLYERRPQISQ